MQCFAAAKLNLYLHLTGRRTDGFHLLDSLACFVDFADELSIEESEKLELELSGAFAEGLSSTDNLVLDSVRLLQKHHNLKRNVKITLKKNIPFGAGLGGGSSDAAAVLLALNQWWELRQSKDQLSQIGLQLGSDVPVCLQQCSAYISGIGDVIKPCNIEFKGAILLVNPRVVLPTAGVYKAFKGQFRKPLTNHPQSMSHDELITLLQSTDNDLAEPASGLCPEISDIIGAIAKTRGNLLARMSGSGSTCFGMYESIEEAELAESEMAKSHPSFWYHLTRLRSYG